MANVIPPIKSDMEARLEVLMDRVRETIANELKGEITSLHLSVDVDEKTFQILMQECPGLYVEDKEGLGPAIDLDLTTTRGPVTISRSFTIWKL